MIFKKYFKLLFFFLFLVVFIFFSLENISGDNFSINKEEEEVTFLVFGHVYMDYNALELSISIIEKENPDFVVFLGDSAYNLPERSWDKFLSIIKKIRVPIYLVPGNHDIAFHKEDKKYFEENISPLFQELSINNNTFIFLNSVWETGRYGTSEFDSDISDEQIEFIKSIYNHNDNNKIIFMHNCLFYKNEKPVCNNQGTLISKDSNWNRNLVPIIKDETFGVFIGDVGAFAPYFSYKENGINYFGVGFSQNKIEMPPHLLKVTIKDGSFKVITIPIMQDLTELNYDLKADKSLRFKIKSFVLNNLKLVLGSLTITITMLLAIILSFLIKLKKFNYLKYSKRL